MTISNLPLGAKLKIFTVAGELIKSFTCTSTDGFARWDLRNDGGQVVASGMYLIHVDVPGIDERILKIAVIQSE